MTRKRILIVEDQQDIRRLIEMVFEDSDYELAEATNAADALAHARTFMPQLVLMDVMMPGDMDGIEACALLKSDPAYGKPVVVMLSAKTQQADFDRGSNAGADAYLSKPFSVAVLESTVQMLLR
jgi:CheY-like chemotaxis protein